MIIINSNTRHFSIPGADLVFGVVADSDAERKHFQCPRYVGDGLDLAACFIRINYRNANGKTDFYLVDDMVIDGDNITFSWLLSPKVTEYRGQVKFVMCAVGPDLKLKWHTTQGTGQVMEGLEPDNSHVESQTADVVAQLISMVEEQTSIVEKVGEEQVATVKATAKTAQDSAVTAIETAGKNTRDSIPADYTALSNAVRKTAPGIVCHAEGEVITLNDASNQAFRGMRIFGKSTQDGTPTPENPVEIVSVGDRGGIGVSVARKNLIAPNAITLINENRNFACYKDKGLYLSSGTYTMSIGKVCDGLYVYAHSDNTTVFVGYNRNTFTFTLNTPQRVWFNFFDSDADLTPSLANTIQLELCNTATAYEPYAGQSLAISAHNSLPGIPVTSGGNYTDTNGQQWVCDEVDFERGVYVRRVSVGIINIATASPVPNGLVGGICLTLDKSYISNTDFMCSNAQAVKYSAGITTGQAYQNHANFVFVGSSNDTLESLQERYNGGKLLYVLATPIETPLSETELAAYRALHTNKPNTTILNDSGAYMSVDYTADTKLYIDNKIKEALL